MAEPGDQGMTLYHLGIFIKALAFVP